MGCNHARPTILYSAENGGALFAAASGPLCRSPPRPGLLFQPAQVSQGVLHRIAAHLGVGRQASAHLGALRPTVDQAAVVLAELNAAHPCRLAAGHTRDGRRDGQGNAAGPAADPAPHGRPPSPLRVFPLSRLCKGRNSGCGRCSRSNQPHSPTSSSAAIIGSPAPVRAVIHRVI